MEREAERVYLVPVEEGLFYADDLPRRDPTGYAGLMEYVKSHPLGDIDFDVLDAGRQLRLLSARQFTHDRFWRAAWDLRAMVACFNFPFDISRLAFKATEARGTRGPSHRDPFAAGFSFALWGYEDENGRWRENTKYRPRLAVKHIDSKRALKGFRAAGETEDFDRVPEGEEETAPDPTWRFRGHFLDLRTLAFVLTDEGHSLESACGAFGVPYRKRKVEHGTITPEYIDYAREDVKATTRLAAATLSEFLKHPVRLQATRAYSPATLGKSYLEAMGVSPILARQHFDPRILGQAMVAYYGGRAEVRIRKVPVPVAYVDFRSMYPTVCALMEIWNLLTCREVQVVDFTSQLKDLLDRVELTDCFDKGLWRKLVGIALVEPQGDVLPARARYSGGQSWEIGVNPLDSQQPLWYSIADVVASKLLTGKAPKIHKAMFFQPKGHRRLRRVELLGEVKFDPKEQDFFRALVEERRRVDARTDLSEDEQTWRSKGLKVLANATSYGIYAQMTRRELPERQRERVLVHGLGEPFTDRVSAAEDPGEYAFPPIAAGITGPARLMLAVLEQLVTDKGGAYAFCDTDSMAIVATQDGGLVKCPGGKETDREGGEAIHALSWQEVQEVISRFESLNPYDRTVFPGSVLGLEDQNFTLSNGARTQRELWCYGISAKRYVLFSLGVGGKPLVLKPSKHGLGHLLNPGWPERAGEEWIDETWEYIVLKALESEDRTEPEWFKRPAVARHTISTPRLLRLFNKGISRGSYTLQVKPFNFCNVAFVPPLERPVGEDRMVLVAPYERDSSRWLETTWWNRYSGRTYRITTKRSEGFERPGLVTVKNFADVIAEYLVHPEAKSMGPDNRPCGRATTGLLGRRAVFALSPSHIGKESNRLEDVQVGLVQDVDDVITEYGISSRNFFMQYAVPVLREIGVREVARRIGASPSAVSAALGGRAVPRPSRAAAMESLAKESAKESLRAWGVAPPADLHAGLVRYAHERQRRNSRISGKD